MTDVTVLREAEQNMAYISQQQYTSYNSPLPPFSVVLANYLRDGYVIDHALLDKNDKLVVILVRGYPASNKRFFRGTIE